MILLNTIMQEAINPALAMLGPRMTSKEARVMMLAIGQQESEFMTRVQKGDGPAHSYWQMERGGGVLGVLNFPGTKFLATDVCKARGVAPTSGDVWLAMKDDDILGAAFARLLLFTDALQLPSINDAANAWELYTRVWRPGKPRPETWADNHARARATVLA